MKICKICKKTISNRKTYCLDCVEKEIKKYTQLYQIILPYACFGVEIKNGYVMDIAPIWKFCKGWSIEKLINYVKEKRGRIKCIV